MNILFIILMSDAMLIRPDECVAFPYETDKIREELTFSSCTSLDDVTPWCYTRIQVGTGKGLFSHGRGKVGK